MKVVVVVIMVDHRLPIILIALLLRPMVMVLVVISSSLIIGLVELIEVRSRTRTERPKDLFAVIILSARHEHSPLTSKVDSTNFLHPTKRRVQARFSYHRTSQVFLVRTFVSFDLGMADGWNTTLERLEPSFSLSHVLRFHRDDEKKMLHDDQTRQTMNQVIRQITKAIRRCTKPLHDEQSHKTMLTAVTR